MHSLNEADSEIKGRNERQDALKEALKGILSSRAAEKSAAAAEDVVEIITTDIAPTGRYEQGFLVITKSSLLTVFHAEQDSEQDGPDPAALEITAEIPLSDIEDVRLEHYVGNGVVTIKTSERVHRFIRFSLDLTDDFQRAVDKVRELVFHEAPVEHSASEHQRGEDRTRCPECGELLRRSVCPQCLEKTKLLRRLVLYVRPHLKKAIVSFSLLLATSLLSLTPPYLTGRLVDDVLYVGDLGRLWNMVLILATVRVLIAVFSGVRTYIMVQLGQGIIRNLRSEVFHHLQYLNMRFYDSVRTGAIMSRTTEDTRNLQRFITQSTQQLLQDIVMLIAVGGMLFWYDPLLAIGVLVPMPVIILGTRLFTKRMHRIYRQLWVRRALMNSVVADAIPGIRVVKAFAQEQQEIDKFDHRSNQVFAQHVSAGRFRSMFMPFIQFSTAIGTLIIWAYGGYLVITTGRMSVGDLVAFLAFVNRFYQPMRHLFNFSDVIMEAATAASRVFEILDTQPEIEETTDTVAIDDVQGRIEFRDVCFSYESHEPVLHNINIAVEPGEMIGLVGSSGSGKSTLVSLIPRLYDVTEGTVAIDGHDVRTIDLGSLRSNIGIVLQDPILFHGTIAENIAYGRPNATPQEIIWAAQAANAHKFIMEFPDAYDTSTGERGLRLSGGQKQRISIARALLKNPKILILDEATSSVDTETEQLIQEAIDNLIKDRTTIAIAHRLSTLKNADRLLVLEDGQIVEEGTHEELMAKNGVFAHLIRIQSEAARVRAV